MNVFDLRKRLVDDYASYTRSFIKIADPITTVWRDWLTDKAVNALGLNERQRQAIAHMSWPS
jgi:hypothetical protein